MHDFEVGIFKPIVSEVVAAEIVAAPSSVRERYTALLALNTEVLKIGDAALDLVIAYQQHEILGANYRNDMLHIALATVAEVDILVSWNFSHIVRFDKIRMFSGKHRAWL
jgi:glycerol-3-phosphate O-acyltransferase